MRRSATLATLIGLAAGATLLTGCQSAGARFLNLIGLEKRPLSVALVADQPAALVVHTLNPFPSYTPFQVALAEHVGRPVAMDVCLPFQADSSLGSGWYDVAVVTPAQYASLSKCGPLNVLAVSVDSRNRAGRSAVLLVREDSDVRGVSDLRGRTVAFGPAGDSRAHHAALRLLEAGGVQKGDLALDLLPVPGALRHLPDAGAVVRAITSGSAAAGFIDEADWEALAAQGADPTSADPDRLRVIARTVALPDVLVVASARLDPRLAKRVQAFLLEVQLDHPTAAAPPTVRGYQVPSGELLAACRGLSAAGDRPAPCAQTAQSTGPEESL